MTIQGLKVDVVRSYRVKNYCKIPAEKREKTKKNRYEQRNILTNPQIVVILTFSAMYCGKLSELEKPPTPVSFSITKFWRIPV